MLRLSDHDLRLVRMQSNGLLPPRAASPVEAVRRVIGIQAQDLPAGLLSVRTRGNGGFTSEDVERARQEEHDLVWTWVMRGTLHLITSADARWLTPLLGPELIEKSRRRIQQLGWAENKVAAGIGLVQEEIAQGGPLTRPEVRRLLAENNLPYEGQAVYHLLVRAAYEGLVCYGPKRGKQNTFGLFDNLAGELEPVSREAGLERLALRYLDGYGPARPEDFANWAGVKVSDARAAFVRIQGQTEPVAALGQELRTLKPRPPDVPEGGPFVRLLPRWDTFLLGYADRDLIIAPEEALRIYPGGGIIAATVLVDGQARGVWKLKRSKKRLEVIVEPFERLLPRVVEAIEAEALDVGRFLGQEADLVIDK